MFCKLPFLDKEILSKISGASEAIGAKKKASKVGLTFQRVATSTTEVMNGDENKTINIPPLNRNKAPFKTDSSSSSSSDASPSLIT